MGRDLLAATIFWRFFRGATPFRRVVTSGSLRPLFCVTLKNIYIKLHVSGGVGDDVMVDGGDRSGDVSSHIADGAVAAVEDDDDVENGY